MPCQPPRPFQSEPLPAFRRPGARNVIYPPRRNNRTYYEAPGALPNNANVCGHAMGERVFAPVSLSFASRSGSGSLVGWSGYRPAGNAQADHDPEAPWNIGPVLKWRRKIRTGAHGFYGNFSDDPVTPYTNVRKDGYGGSESFDAATGAYTTACTYGTAFSQDYPPDVSPSWASITPALAPAVAGNPGLFSPAQGYVLTLRRLTVAQVAASPDPRITYHSTCYFELQDPETVYDALTRAGVILGALTETLPGSVGLTGPSDENFDNTNPVPVEAATAVRVTITFTRLDPSRSHVLRGVYLYRPLLGGATVAVPFEEPATVSGYTATVSHDLPVSTGHGVSIASGSLRLVAI